MIPFGIYWDLSQVINNKLPSKLCKVILGEQIRLRKFHKMSTAFSTSDLLAVTNSNGCDDPVLKIYLPKD